MVEPELKPMSFPLQSSSPSPILPLRSHLCESSKYSWPLLSSFSVSFPSPSDSGDFSVLSHCSGVPLCICSVFSCFFFFMSLMNLESKSSDSWLSALFVAPGLLAYMNTNWWCLRSHVIIQRDAYSKIPAKSRRLCLCFDWWFSSKKNYFNLNLTCFS